MNDAAVFYDIWVDLSSKSGGCQLTTAIRLGVCGDAYDIIVFTIATATAVTIVNWVES